MNRYICAGILADLAEGRTVLVVSPSLREAWNAHHALVDHAIVVAERDPTAYRWAAVEGGSWLRDEDTKVAATFTTLRSGMVAHVQADVIVINRSSDMVHHYIDEHGDVAYSGIDEATAKRLQSITTDRDLVVID